MLPSDQLTSEDVTRFVESWQTSLEGSTEENLFTNMCTVSYRQLSQSGSDGCLAFNGTTITTKPLKSFSDYDVTIELDVTVSVVGAASDCYAVLEYEREETKAVTLLVCPSDVTGEVDLRVTYTMPNKGSFVRVVVRHDLPFRILLHKWYHVAITWKKNDAMMSVSDWLARNVCKVCVKKS